MKTAVIATAAIQSGNEECSFWGLYASTAVPDLGHKRLMFLYYKVPNKRDVTINDLRVTMHASLSLLNP